MALTKRRSASPTSGETRRTNWAGNVRFSARKVASPTSTDELQEIIAGAEKVKAIGTGHSFSAVADTDGLQLDLTRLPRIVELHPAARRVRVSAGLRYSDVVEMFHRNGFALANLPSLPDVSMIGAIQTATHGSGKGQRSLADSVHAIEMIRSDGELVRVQRGDPDFAGVVVGLGSLGVVTSIELNLVETYDIRQRVYEDLPLERAQEEFDGLMASGYSVSLFHSWSRPNFVDSLLVKRKVGGVGRFPMSFFGARRAARSRHPVRGVSASTCTQQLGVVGPWFDRLPHFRIGGTAARGAELQSEYFVPRAQSSAALEQLRRCAASFRQVLLVNEVRIVSGDDHWLSYAYGTDVTGFHFTWKPDREEVWKAVREIERHLVPLGARPHLGKIHSLSADEVTRHLPMAEPFRSLRSRYDPRGAFANSTIESLGL